MSLFNESLYSLYLLHLGRREKGRRRLQSTHSLSTKHAKPASMTSANTVCRLDAKQISLDDPVDSKETLANLRKFYAEEITTNDELTSTTLQQCSNLLLKNAQT